MKWLEINDYRTFAAETWVTGWWSNRASDDATWVLSMSENEQAWHQIADESGISRNLVQFWEHTISIDGLEIKREEKNQSLIHGLLDSMFTHPTFTQSTHDKISDFCSKNKLILKTILEDVLWITLWVAYWYKVGHEDEWNFSQRVIMQLWNEWQIAFIQDAEQYWLDHAPETIIYSRWL